VAVVLECLDATAPAAGSGFLGCTQTEWVEEPTFSLPNWTMAQYGEVASAVWLLFAVLFVIRAVRKHAA
jgi:hypothetical protein